MADGSVVIGVQLDTAAFSASAVRLEQQIMTLGNRLNSSLNTSMMEAGIGDSLTGAFLSMSNAATSMAQHLTATLRTAAAEAISGFVSAGWQEAGYSSVRMLADGVRAGQSSVSGAVRETSAQAKGAFDTGGWDTIGSSMMSGIAAGIRAAGNEVIAAIEEVSRQTESAVKGHFKINSPSALMRDEVGVMISRGIAEGITGGASYLTADGMGGAVREGGNLPRQTGNVTQNIYLRDSDTSPYQTARRIRKESEAAMRL